MKNKDYRTIEDYLEGLLDAESAATVEARAAEEPAFAAALADRRQLYDHLRTTAAEEDLRSVLSPLGDKYFAAAAGTPSAPRGHEAVVRQLPRRRGVLPYLLGAVAVAAAVLLLVFAGGLFTGAPGNAYEQFAQHQPLSLTERGEGDNGISAAEAAYNDGRYREAEQLLTPYVTENPEDQRARLALGISKLEQGADAGAVEIFEAVAASGGAVAPYANWYLALAAVKRDDKTAALTFLDRIDQPDNYLRSRIADLREVLQYN